MDQIGLHLHNTYGMAIANITMAMADHGISMVESSCGGLGGCPYAPGATGNVATEDVLYLCKKLGIETGVDLNAMVETARWVTAKLQDQEQEQQNGDAGGSVAGGGRVAIQSSLGKAWRQQPA